MTQPKFIIISTILSLGFLVSCGVYRIPLMVDGKQYEKKTFSFDCGKLTIQAKVIRGNYLVDMKLLPNPQIELYPDSVKTFFKKKWIKNSFDGMDSSILKEKTTKGFFVEIDPILRTGLNTDTVQVFLNGAILCEDKPVQFERILLIKEK